MSATKIKTIEELYNHELFFDVINGLKDGKGKTAYKISKNSKKDHSSFRTILYKMDDLNILTYKFGKYHLNIQIEDIIVDYINFVNKRVKQLRDKNYPVYNGGDKMKIKELIKELQKYNQDADILFSIDEEFNCLRSEGQVAIINDEKTKVAIYGLDGTEIEY
jgi:hypothetical protein